MAQSHVLSGLLKKHSELLGEIETKSKELDELVSNLKVLEKTCKIFDPNTSLSENRPKRTYKANSLFARGEAPRLILEALRGQSGLKTSELVDIISKHKGFGEEVRKEATTLINRTLRNLANKGQVKSNKLGAKSIWYLV